MSFLARIFGSSESARDPMDDRWFAPAPRMTASGVAVTRRRALSVPVIQACCSTLVETISTLPLIVGERMSGGEKRRAQQHPLAAVLAEPNEEMTGVDLMQALLWDLVTDGDAFAEIVPGPRGPVDQLRPIAFRHVSVQRATDGGRRYIVTEPGMPERRLLDSEVWHLRRAPFSDDGCGTGPIEMGREAIGAAIALREYGARFFENDATPPYWLVSPTPFKDAESRRSFLAAIKRAVSGRNRGTPGLLEYGIEPRSVAVDNQKSQFLETRKLQDIELTRLWRMPAHKVGIMDQATFSNIEQQALEFVIDTLLPWLRLIEKSAAKNLIVNRQRFFVEFNVAGLLRGDIKARYEAYATARQWGWLSVNEIRALENMNGIGRVGDEYTRPMNMEPLGTPPEGGSAAAITFLRNSVYGGRHGA